MKPYPAPNESCSLCRRDFLRTVGVVAGSLAFGCTADYSARKIKGPAIPAKEKAMVHGAFFYPPSDNLREPGVWWSWPGKDFDAEGRQKQYMNELGEIERDIGMQITMQQKPIDSGDDLARFVQEVNQSKPDGLLLVPFKHSHFDHINRVINDTEIPAVVFTCMGVKHGSIKGYQRPGVCMVQTMDNFDALAYCMRMIHTAKTMKQSRIISIAGSGSSEHEVPRIGTKVRVIPMQQFVDEVDRTKITDAVKDLARSYMKNAKKILEPAEPEIITAAKVHFALERVIESEKGDAVMVDCLRRGLYMPCMSFMTLRDIGFAAGCENDLSGTLTLMLTQLLFDRPGFEHNPCFETESNHYFASHCTSASKLFGTREPAEPYLLRDYAHTNDPTCVPQVLWRPGRPVTMAHYEPSENPSLLLYTGKVVKSHSMPPVGGCRTNVEITINELEDVREVKGHHNVLFYGNFSRKLKQFAQLYDITVEC